uniref:Uncharacterized protein n=1 Tax=Plectus sambesii TaxID=2011161 RepID=A0A914XAZ1_9BILA
MAKTKRSLREAHDAKSRSRPESDCSSPNRASGSAHDRSSCSRDDVVGDGNGSVRRSTRSTKGVPSRRVQQENEESGSLSLLERVVRESRSKSPTPDEKDYSPANSDITPTIAIEAALRALDPSVGGEKRSSPESLDSFSLTNAPNRRKRTWPKQYRKLEPFDGVEHPACSICGGKVRPQKGGINSRNEYWWRCLNKTCRRWYGRTTQRPDVERSRRQSAAKQRRKRERAKEQMDEMGPIDDQETKVFRKLRRQSRLRRGERLVRDSSSDSWRPDDDDDDYKMLVDDATDSTTTADDNEWFSAHPVLAPPPIERLQMYNRPLSWSVNKSQLRIVNVLIPCPEQTALVKLL